MRHSSTTDDQHDANWPAVLSMAITMFALVCSELLPISILTPMAKDLEMSVGEAGQAVTATAVVAAVASPAVIVLAGRIDRRLLIRGLTVVLLLSSLLASVATDQWTLLFARGLLGVALGGTWAMVTTLALRLLSPAQVARAMSIIFTGVTAASVAAPAAGAFLGETWGWRGVFLVTAGLGVLALLAQLSTLPRLPTMHRPALNAFGDALSRAPVLGGLVTIVLVLSGQFAGYTFIRPLLEQVVNQNVSQISLALLLYGIGGLIGGAVGGLLAARNASLCAAGAALVMALMAALLAFAGTTSLISLLLLVIWGLAFSAFYVSIATWHARVAPDLAESVGALQATAFQFSIALGAGVGGVAIDTFGLSGVFSYACAALLAGAAVILTTGVRSQRRSPSL